MTRDEYTTLPAGAIELLAEKSIRIAALTKERDALRAALEVIAITEPTGHDNSMGFQASVNRSRLRTAAMTARRALAGETEGG